MKENVAKMGSGNTSGTQTRKVFFSDLCCVDNVFAVNYSISHRSDLTDLWLAETSQTINVFRHSLGPVCSCCLPADCCFFSFVCGWCGSFQGLVWVWHIGTYLLCFFSCTWWHSSAWVLCCMLFSYANHFVLCHCSVKSALSFLHVSQSPHHNSPVAFSANRTSPQRKPEVT